MIVWDLIQLVSMEELIGTDLLRTVSEATNGLAGTLERHKG